MNKSRFILLPALLALSLFSTVASAHPKPQVAAVAAVKPTCSHAICRVAGVVLFAVEDGIDVVHGTLDIASKGLAAVAPVKVLIPVQYVVTEADAIVAKVDTGAEHAEQFLFGVSN
jgi:hypothetical protein